MLQLFQSIFGSEPSAPSVHSAELVERAIERAVEATDSRLRAVSGYKKTLRSAVTHALDHVVALVGDCRRYSIWTRAPLAPIPR